MKIKDLKDYTFDELVETHAQHVHAELLLHGGLGLKDAVHSAMRIAIDWREARSKLQKKEGKKND